MSTGEVRFIGSVTDVDGDISVITIDEKYFRGLDKLDSYSEMDVLFWFHERDDVNHRNVLTVVPRRHGETEPRGVFASHSPSRPNPIGLTRVEIISVDGCRVTVRGFDAFEGSPIVDMKTVRAHKL
ncbi:tRNA (N6-threonylcarbamoyladenosine(37)-N6)-methyltransferase TrmO [Candidatus Bathyarchaeota archaeon]|jgi:tRNA-Thr(GGU) m(6)t(6)A37 methyltransferase TsaA|nr:tRNA (N6-threonylcarbamoyladenosine(37)-N6)-methyltransferase TrmO [Candidatus Bathyarchaeota archaeon]MBT4319859.1 tRNA (N6-threonylcarbamoyladenosine(37)-N6)-methyltransferase TrmO [Candidatus Bathyarchaeota archaeon]MBT4423985.1 tRNA (N6-threonylcarbamoyladenosine(37)-N6)-methyltransferase TrmO [Candidatus Bathyarchaeota archaeon]MBT5641862.1 tRNA (N6-threonylcarbamoyladenosine(37)-N6)-methyltransferase TrmO [Candidatus Bathyarchaeota archaeon]MBT6605918.1 tRNA (N6-threonylcarbamoyladenos